MSTPSISKLSTASQPIQGKLPELRVPLLSVHSESVLFGQSQIAKDPYFLTITSGHYSVYSLANPGSTIIGFVEADIISVTWDRKRGIVSVRIACDLNTGWYIEFEKGECAKTVAYFLMS